MPSRRGGRVVHVDDLLALDEEEVVDELAVEGHRLGAHACGRRFEMFLAHLGHEPLERAYEGSLAEGSPHLSAAGAPVASRHADEAGVGQRFEKVADRDVALAITFAREGENGVRAALDAPWIMRVK